MKVIKDLFDNNLSQGLQFGLQWLLNIVILGQLGLAFFGEFSFYYSISNFLMPILPFGSFVFLMSKNFDNKEEAVKEFYVSFQLQFLFFSLISLASLTFCVINQNANFLAYIILAFLNGYFLSLNTLVFIFHKSFGNYRLELMVNVFKAFLIGLLILYVLVNKDVSIVLILGTLLIINIIAFISSYFKSDILYLNHLRYLFEFNFWDLKKRFLKQKYYGFQDILTVSFVQGGMLLLPLLILEDTYGMYRGMLLIVAPFGLLNLTFSQVLLNQIKSLSILEKGKAFHSMQKVSIIVLVFILGVMFLFRELIMNKIAKIELNSETNIAFLGIGILIFSSFVYSSYEMLLVVLDKQKLRLGIMIIGAVVNLIAIFCLLPQYGLIGAIGTNVISSVIVFGFIMFIGEMELKKVSKA